MTTTSLSTGEGRSRLARLLHEWVQCEPEQGEAQHDMLQNAVGEEASQDESDYGQERDAVTVDDEVLHVDGDVHAAEEPVHDKEEEYAHGNVGEEALGHFHNFIDRCGGVAAVSLHGEQHKPAYDAPRHLPNAVHVDDAMTILRQANAIACHNEHSLKCTAQKTQIGRKDLHVITCQQCSFYGELVQGGSFSNRSMYISDSKLWQVMITTGHTADDDDHRQRWLQPLHSLTRPPKVQRGMQEIGVGEMQVAQQQKQPRIQPDQEGGGSDIDDKKEKEKEEQDGDGAYEAQEQGTPEEEDEGDRDGAAEAEEPDEPVKEEEEEEAVQEQDDKEEGAKQKEGKRRRALYRENEEKTWCVAQEQARNETTLRVVSTGQRVAEGDRQCDDEARAGGRMYEICLEDGDTDDFMWPPPKKHRSRRADCTQEEKQNNKMMREANDDGLSISASAPTVELQQILESVLFIFMERELANSSLTAGTVLGYKAWIVLRGTSRYLRSALTNTHEANSFNQYWNFKAAIHFRARCSLGAEFQTFQQLRKAAATLKSEQRKIMKSRSRGEQNWPRNGAQLIDCEKILFVVHVNGNHWVLFVAHMQLCKLQVSATAPCLCFHGYVWAPP